MFWKAKKLSRKLELIAGSGLGFTIDDWISSCDNNYVVAFDKTWQMLCIIDQYDQVYYLNPGEVVSTDILIEKTSYHKKPIGELLFRQAIGELISGESGKSLAKWTTKSISKEKTRSVKLRIVINDFNNPTHIICLFRNGSKSQLNRIEKPIERWKGRFELFQKKH